MFFHLQRGSRGLEAVESQQRRGGADLPARMPYVWSVSFWPLALLSVDQIASVCRAQAASAVCSELPTLPAGPLHSHRAISGSRAVKRAPRAPGNYRFSLALLCSCYSFVPKPSELLHCLRRQLPFKRAL